MNRKHIALTIMTVMMTVLILAGCAFDPPVDPGKPHPEKPDNPEIVQPDGERYTYKESVGQMPSNWNPHIYQTTDDRYPLDKISMGFYEFIFNDQLHPVKGVADYEGWTIIPEMASALPVDITEEIRAMHPEFGIPSNVTKGYAYQIPLNRDACFENGIKINAHTYVDSMKWLLDPRLMNYRASDYYLQEISIAGAEYYSNQGQSKVITVAQVMANEGLDTLDEFITKYGDDPGYINWAFSFGAEYDFDKNPIPDKNAIDIDMDAFVDPVDEVKQTPLTFRQLVRFYCDVNHLLQGASEEVVMRWVPDELYIKWKYPAAVSFDEVGCYAKDDYNLVLVLEKQLEGFQLYDALRTTWLVEPDLYEACLTETNGVWTSRYNTSVDTTLSYGPYRLVSYTDRKNMRFEKNPNWYGWSDGKHIYVDPNDGKVYMMYQTTDIDVQNVEEASTRKLMFLKGELSEYGLQSEDFAQYRDSEYAKVVPDETIFFLILNGHLDAIQQRENAEGFNKSTTDIETITLLNFRKAVAVTYDKELFAATVSPQRSGAYGIIGEKYVYDPMNGLRYRESDQAKQVLCDFYSVDVSKYVNIDQAVDSITGFDPIKARELYTLAFQDALAAGYITDSNNDGISDQTVTIEYCLSQDSSFMTKTVNYLNEKMNEVTAGTPFANKVRFVKSAPYGNEWSNKIKSGMSDTVLGGWSGSTFNPFGLADLYTNPAYQYDAEWFDSSRVDLTLDIQGSAITMNLRKWSDALNGSTVEQDGIEYNFGEGQVDIDTRLDILAAIEGEVLKTYDYIPLLQNAGIKLQSQQIYDVVDEYNAVLGFGGLPYLKYKYNDAEWAEYVKAHGGELDY